MTEAENVLHRALNALYIAVDKSVADSVNNMVRARVEELESGIRAALNMVDGDGLPPNWDALRELVNR